MNTEQRATAELNWFKSSYSGDHGGDCVEVAVGWRKSTYSSSQGDNCVEVALGWSKSSYSGGEGGACIEVAACPSAVHVRDSKEQDGPQLTVAPGAWAAFVGMAAGQRTAA